MDVRNCQECGKIYSYDGFNTCQQCRRSEEKDFKIVKDYIWENPGAGISEVSEETEIPTKKIIEFLRQGRLEIKDQSNMVLPCEKCGESIKTGRFCEKCTLAMDREFKQSIGGGNNPSQLGSGSIKTRIGITDRYKKN